MKDSRTKNWSKKTNAATFFYCAFTLPALTVGASAYADDAVLEPTSDTVENANTRANVSLSYATLASFALLQLANSKANSPASAEPNQGGQVRNDQPDTTNAIVNAEADQTVTPPTPPSSQAASKGFVTDSHLNLQFRNYSDYFQAPTSIYRHAWIQGAQANYESGFTQGLIGFGVDASLFAALKLDGGNGAGNMVHVGKDGGGSQQLAWAYPGMYDIKGRISETVVKYGLQTVTNPFLEPHDNRALPPTFLGVSMVSNDLVHTTLEAGSFTKVDARGHTNLTNLTTSYGGTRIDRLTYVGGTWHYAKNGEMALYVDQADDVWRQCYGSVAQSFGDPATSSGAVSRISTRRTIPAHHARGISTATRTACRSPRSTARMRCCSAISKCSAISSSTMSTRPTVSTWPTRWTSTTTRRMSSRCNCATRSTANTPVCRGSRRCSGASTAGARTRRRAPRTMLRASAPLHDLYWKNGEPVHGHHHEFGFIPSYTLQSGRFKDTKVTFIAMWHNASRYYSDGNNMEYRLVVNVPVKVF